MECPKCGNEVRDNEKKCPHCGKVLLLECPVCHKLNRSSVCSECGHVIIVKCHNCGTPGPNNPGKCRKCGFDTAKSVIMNEAETEEYACLAITFPNIETLRPALKNKQIFNKFKKKLKQALFEYAKAQDNRAQLFGDTYVIKYYKEFSFTSSVKKAVKSAIELLNKIGGISYKLKKSKNVRLHCKMTILKKTFETDKNEFNTGLNIKLIKDTTVEKYTDGLQLITDQYINNVISREYSLEMIYSSQVGDELLMFYEFPLEDQIIPIVIEEKNENTSILKGSQPLPKLKIYDDDDKLDDILYGNKAINITTEGQFLSVPSHNIFNTLNELLVGHTFITLKTTERRDIPSQMLFNFVKSKMSNVVHVVCKESYKYSPYAFFKDLAANLLHIDLKQDLASKQVMDNISYYDGSGLLGALLTNSPTGLDPDSAYAAYLDLCKEIIEKQKGYIFLIENFDLIDDSSLKVINNYLMQIINVDDLNVSFLVTVRSDYSVNKNLPKLLHSHFYKEINVTKGEYSEFLAQIPENIEEIKESFYISKLEERSAGSLIYFTNELQYLRDSNVFITFEDKLIINAEKTLVFPGSIKELFAQRFSSLPESEGLVIAYTLLMDGAAHIEFLKKLNINELDKAIESLISKSLILYNDDIVQVVNTRIFRPAFLKAVSQDVKQILISNIIERTGYICYELNKLVNNYPAQLDMIYEMAMKNIAFGDFNAYLNCAKEFLALVDQNRLKNEEIAERKKNIYSLLINHLNRYPSTKVYSISKAILNNAIENNDDETIVNVSNLILDSALNGGDYVLAQQCIQNILTRILNPKLLAENVDYTPQFILYSCIQGRIAFHLSHYTQCIVTCDKILNTLTPEFLRLMSMNGIESSQFISYVMEVLVYSAFARIIIGDNSLIEFLSGIKEKINGELLSSEYLILLNKLIHFEEYDVDAGIPNDTISSFISNILIAFKNFDEGYDTFAQNIYKAKLSAQSDHLDNLSLLCDLFIGYSYQKINLEQNISWTKCERIYEDVSKTAQKFGFNSLVQIANWFKATLLKDKGMYNEAYDLVISISNSLKRLKIKNRVLSLITYILTLNIVSKIDERKSEVPILVYRITYEAEKFGLEEYYRFIEDKRVLDEDYITQFEEQIRAEQEVILAEQEAEQQQTEAEEKEALDPTYRAEEHQTQE